MSMILAIDQGTSSSRALIFDQTGKRLGVAQHPFKQHYPNSGWVEHDAEDIWETTLKACRDVLAQKNLSASDIATIGITNQRETVVLWDRVTGKPVYHALVWQDRRTADFCAQLRSDGLEKDVQQRSGLLLDPYFSASKLLWLLENVGGLRARAENGELAFGTIDCFLLWRLTGGKSHKTDITNASRTQLFNIQDKCWDSHLLKLFDIPENLMPEVAENTSDFGTTEKDILGGEISINGMVGDQQGALIGQACFEPGTAKSTYGTGCFLVVNTGTQPVISSCRLLTTIGYQIKGVTNYALEGSIFNAGTVVQWLRDELGLIKDAAESEAIARQTTMQQGVYLIPAFTGLGAPYWEPNVRGSIVGLTRDTDKNQLVTAGLLSVVYQTRDLMEAVRKDRQTLTTLKVDGGMSQNNWLLRQLSDQLDIPVIRPLETETTALGAAYLAALGKGLFSSVEEISHNWQADEQFLPEHLERHNQAYQGWQKAVDHLIG